MRHLLNTLFVLSEDSYLSLDGENVVVLHGEETTGRFPLHNLESILCFSYKGASPALMGGCASRGVALCFFTPRGRFLARVSGKIQGNILLRKEQYRRSDDELTSCELARCFIFGKIYNARWVLERATRDHPQRVDVPMLKKTSQSLAGILPQITDSTDLGELRGLEGAAAACYFSAAGELILQNRDAFTLSKRSRRPPLDPINALLSFVYTLLSNDCANALEAAGLDPYAGFLHRDRPGRASLALDLMEELRAPAADRFVFSLINNRIVAPDHFQLRESGAVLLTDEGRRAVLAAWQTRKQESITHPYLGEKLPWGLVPYVQALLLARCLRGDLDAYPPFLWK